VKNFKNISIIYKLTFLITIVVIITITLIVVFSYRKTREAILNRTLNQLTSVCFEKTARLNSFISGKVYELEYFSTAPNTAQLLCDFCNYDIEDSVVNSSLTNSFNQHIGNYLRIRGDVKSFIIVTNDYEFWSMCLNDSIDEFKSIELSFELTEKLTVQDLDSTYITDYQRIEDSAYWYIFTPVISEKVFGLVGYQLSSKPINDIMLENNPYNGLGKSGEAYLVGKDRYMRSQSRFVNNSVMNTIANSSSVDLGLKGQTGTSLIEDYRGVEVLSSYSFIEFCNTRWAVIAEIDYLEAFIPVNTYRNSMYFLFFVTALLLSSFIMLLLYGITQPLSRLKQAAEKISSGIYNIKLQVKNKDEVGLLTETFNLMATKILEQQAKIEVEKTKRLSDMIEWQEQEKHRFSRELHDGLGQLLLSIKMRFGRVKGLTEHDNTLIKESDKLLADAVQDVRNISNDLMPTALNELGLKEAVNTICNKLAEDAFLNIEKDIKIGFLPDKVASLYLYRIIQEGLNNIVKHADAKNVKLSLTIDQKQIEIIIADDGKGMPDNYINLGGQGLRNMKERIMLLKGSISISNTHKGTKIQIFIPLQI
jgi:signal transduction histidine kinase